MGLATFLERTWSGLTGLVRPRSAATMFRLADQYRHEGRYEEAADLITEGLRVAPNIAVGHLLDAYLHVLVTLEDTEEHKPDPAPLLLAVERMGCTPAEAVYVGDAVVDVQAARRAGMAAVGVTWAAGARSDVVAARPDVVADTVDDLRAALLG